MNAFALSACIRSERRIDLGRGLTGWVNCGRQPAGPAAAALRTATTKLPHAGIVRVLEWLRNK